MPFRHISYCAGCKHTNTMHHDFGTKACGYPFCTCKRWRPEPTLTDYTKKLAR